MENVLKYKGYIGSVEYSNEDEVFHGKLELVNDLVTYEGESAKELKKNFQDAVDGYIDFCQSKGKEPEKPYKGMFNVRVDQGLHKKAAMIAVMYRTSLNNVVTTALEKYVKEVESDEHESLAMAE
ncbi:type II toxin-antitoxin system HicB family antitoxin [Pontibacter silvestris]|uniref:Type II toxin-antitoxin system HicB family antitoxin n=1 Tax=Pontibacter silvestris TaxID=2305183 RepID=A0ABW4WXV3_9BACT|nr:type II toxin-antitoxin system HicB family antitoxin [Pontibacter silvestris]MCC9138861.1 type II toxin-antitoxin system HicB family antitoxin [Pontibacter silvestris]